MAEDIDPETATLAPRFPDLFDRHVVVVNDLSSLPPRENGAVILSAGPLVEVSRFTLLGRTYASDVKSNLLASKLTTWFNYFIARRRQGDRLDVGAGYFLYRIFSSQEAEQKRN